MANKKISELPAIVTINDSIEFPVNDGGTTKKATQLQGKNDIKDYMIESGAGAPSSTPDFIGQRYIDTTANRQYIATGTSSSADWDKVAVFKSGTVTVTGGSGDVTITLPWDWTGGLLELHISDSSSDYFDTGNAGNTLVVKTSYIALTSGTYTDGQDLFLQRNDVLLPEIFEIDRTANSAGAPKSATTFTFVLDDNGADTKYIKWFVTS